MKILFVGGDGRGSWQMRGVQLARAMGARATLKPTVNDWAWADVVVLVKRAAMVYAKDATRLSVPVVWDALDFWSQPDENDVPRAELVAQAKQIQRDAGITLTIGATRAMAEDLRGVYLPHHCRQRLAPVQIRSTASVVGYDGTPKYLGKWRAALEQACFAVGHSFVVNPSDLRDVDALVAFRDGRHDGDVCRWWKSGVKHVNAIVAGRPMVSQASAAHNELVPIGMTVESTDELVEALRVATGLEMREAAYEYGKHRAGQFTVEAVAAEYLAILKQAARRAA